MPEAGAGPFGGLPFGGRPDVPFDSVVEVGAAVDTPDATVIKAASVAEVGNAVDLSNRSVVFFGETDEVGAAVEFQDSTYDRYPVRVFIDFR